jgi:hypothetical protein
MCIDVIHHKKIQQNFSTHNLSFEMYVIVHTLWHVLFHHIYIPYVQVLQDLLF